MPRPVLVIREVEQLARRAKWRTCDLAEALGVSVAMLNRLRAGTHAPSRDVLGAILRAFGTNVQVRDLVLHFLEHELALARAGRLDAAPERVRDAEEDLHALDAKVRGELRGFVIHFLRRSLTSGTGLHVIGDDANALRAVVAYVRTTLDAQGVASVVLAGNATVSTSLRETALAAPLLIVERAEFASESVRTLFEARASIRKPVLLTSARTLPDETADAVSRTAPVLHLSLPRVHAAV
ncbi:MAG TPA: helix-turn-helix transcriptional regulator [Thermoanaerobaculia bacterium]|nr:helix-turn-helix transcriptional regulator [Thermoanaerobaculia bacterium]